MVKLIYGMAGTGKSTYVYDQIVKDLENKKRVLLLTPEQQAVLSERAIAERTKEKNVSTLELEILSFRRLANHVFRMYGGLCYRYLEDSGKYLVLWATLSSISPYLQAYTKTAANDTGFLERLHTTFTEFTHANVLPSHLDKAADELEADSPKIASKLRDISLLYAAYSELLHKEHEDPNDDLVHLKELLESHKESFKGYHIYIDSFQGYTKQELDVLAALIPQADDVTITLCYDPTLEEDMLSTARKTDRQIKAILKKQPDQIIELKTPHRFTSPALPYLAENLYRLGQTDAVKCNGSVQILACNTPMTEAEAIAREIIKLTARGLRYNQIAIITRGVDRYAGILDVVLDSYNIPHFFSVREPLSAKPIYRLVLGALDVLRNNWKLDDVNSYIKTGLVNIPDADLDSLISYLERWNIYGSRWTDSAEWNMNPKGYTDEMSPKSEEILKKVNDIRWAIYRPLDTLRSAFHDNTTVHDALIALVRFLEELNVPEQVRTLADETATQHYNGLMRSFDQIDAVAGSLPVTIGILSQLLNCVVSHTDLGSIPSFVDQVLVGDAALLRASDIKHAFLIGANDGAFPKTVVDGDLFSDLERIQLETHGVATVDSIGARTNDELFYVYRACTMPSDSLTITYHTHDFLGHAQHPSILVDRALVLFQDCKAIEDSQLSLVERTHGMSTALSNAFLYKNTEEGSVLYDILANDPAYSARVAAFEEGLISGKDIVSNTALASEKDIKLSQTRFESFVKCPLQYHCRYTLKLSSPQRSDFSSVETGNFVHRILELVLKKLHDGKKLRTDVTEEELEQVLQSEIDTFIARVVGSQDAFSKRMHNLFRKLRQTILLLLQNILEEFAQSKFSPQFFEMDMSQEANPYVIELSDKSKITFIGKVDRVDTYVDKSNNKVYLRVVDYKTGTKVFSLSDIEMGINLQMLIYLFSLWNDPPATLRDRVGDIDKDMEYLPAGVLYHIAATKPVDGQIDTSPDTAVARIKTNIVRDGLVLDEALPAMDANLSGQYQYVPLTETRKIKKSSLKTLAEFGALQQQINDTIDKIVMEMKKGTADARPLTKQDPCRYCDFVAVCRAKKARATDEPSDEENTASDPLEE